MVFYILVCCVVSCSNCICIIEITAMLLSLSLCDQCVALIWLVQRTKYLDIFRICCFNPDTTSYLCFPEVPEVPYGLRVLDKSGRSVQLSWAAPYDGNSPIKRYLVEYKISRGESSCST
jgi:hypothetical protein